MQANLVLFASGSGSNAENVARYFANHPTIKVRALFCNKPEAGVIPKMQAFNIPVVVFNKAQFHDPEFMLQALGRFEPSLICLLGFLWKVPEFLVDAYPNQILNLHPALLPKFGGKGMYGMHVHLAVQAAGEKQSGITIHWVNAHYDEGAIISQFSFEIPENADAHDIANAVHLLEQQHVPEVIEKVVFNLKK